MSKQVAAIKEFLADETAAGLAEYALLLALISLVCVVALGPLGLEIKDVFEDLGEFFEKHHPGGS
jgi:Flp pilus assembly pilin Flp